MSDIFYNGKLCICPICGNRDLKDDIEVKGYVTCIECICSFYPEEAEHVSVRKMEEK